MITSHSWRQIILPLTDLLGIFVPAIANVSWDARRMPWQRAHLRNFAELCRADLQNGCKLPPVAKSSAPWPQYKDPLLVHRFLHSGVTVEHIWIATAGEQQLCLMHFRSLSQHTLRKRVVIVRGGKHNPASKLRFFTYWQVYIPSHVSFTTLGSEELIGTARSATLCAITTLCPVSM